MGRRVLLVEGPSDVNALTSLAGVLAADLAGVGMIDMGGITNLRRHLAELADDDTAGVLYDAGEAAHVVGVIADSPHEVAAFECVQDLEDELIRALGVPRVVEIVQRAGDLAAWRTISNQPFHRDRPADQVMRRFFGAGSGRKKKYAGLLAASLVPSCIPEPMLAAMEWATGE